MVAPYDPREVELPKGVKLYRVSGSNDPWLGNFFGLHEEVARRYRQYHPHPWLHTVQVTQSFQLILLMDPQTRDYFASYSTSALSEYETYISPGTVPVAANADSLPAIYADATGSAPLLRDLVARHHYRGWLITEGHLWHAHPPIAFHPEVMVTSPRRELTHLTALQLNGES